MSDQDIGDELQPHGLNAIAAFRHGDGFVISLMDDTGELHTFTMSLKKARNASTVINLGLMGIPQGSASALKLFE
ncbi:hypothetical protein [Mycolicibacterium smegmatis]|uniref:hypothetical protein n=1 Tax=Mycolicibacterium smegmatis TaxID=1772 RepID=UPI001EFB0344|nr:hypothetical protein [Mycolicibacterium smegmatis]ULN33621.1 hypothetical protein KZ781_22790 [Mycolicibacterium smegmatis]